jgi:hypothetical protein
MVTLEVNRIMITWPDDFALMMMRYYRNHGVSFIVHRNCVHSARPMGNCSPAKAVESTRVQEDYEYAYCALVEKQG